MSVMDVHADVEVTHQFLVCLKHLWVILLHLLQLHCAGEISSYDIDPIGRLDVSHISCNANPTSPTGVKNVPKTGQYSSKMEKIRHTHGRCP